MLPMFLRDRHLRRAVVLWGVFATAFAVRTEYYSYVGKQYDSHTVYPQFAAASRHWWADKSLYASYTLDEGIDGYRYSPTFAIAFTPFTKIHHGCGVILWDLTSVILLVWALRRARRDLLPGRWTTRWEGLFLSLALAGYAVGLWSGQSNALVSALVLLAMSAIVRRRWWAAAWLLAVPVFIKLWPIAVVLLLLACWPRQLSLRFVAACLVLAAAPFTTRSFHTVLWQYHAWYASLTGPLQGRWPGYRDAWTIWDQLWPPVNDRVYTVMQLGTAAAVLAWCLWQRRRLTRPGEAPHKLDASPFLATGYLLMLTYAIWASWQLLFGPGSEQLTYGILAPATSWALLVSFKEKKVRWLTLPAWAMSALLASGDIEKRVLMVFPHGQILLPLSVVLFMAWLLWHERGEWGATVEHH